MNFRISQFVSDSPKENLLVYALYIDNKFITYIHVVAEEAAWREAAWREAAWREAAWRYSTK